MFLFFNPGVFEQDPKHRTLLQDILERHNESDPNYDPNLYLCGVVNQDIPQLTEPGGAKNGKTPPTAVMKLPLFSIDAHADHRCAPNIAQKFP